MALPIVTKIGEASKDAWPPVLAAITTTMRSMTELAGISEEVLPKVEEYVARGDGASVRRRKICEETIWVLASLGWLRTGPERDVILAAKAWVDIDGDVGDLAVLDAAEDDLVEAIGKLPEYMSRPTQEV